MEQRISIITLGVEDLPAMQRFYTETLGWQPVAQNKDIVFYKLNGILFSLFGREPLAKGSGIEAAGSGFRGFVLALNFNTKEEVDKLHEELNHKGITIPQPPIEAPFGAYFFTFTDPENNVWEVAHNPFIPLDGEGNVITHKSIDDL